MQKAEYIAKIRERIVTAPSGPTPHLISKATKRKIAEDLKAKAIADLKKWIDPEHGIIIVQKSVSPSGMQRGLEVYNHNLTARLTHNMAEALGWGLTKDRHLKVKGCGMDMHFATAYELTHTLYSEEERAELAGNGSGCLPWRSL